MFWCSRPSLLAFLRPCACNFQFHPPAVAICPLCANLVAVVGVPVDFERVQVCVAETWVVESMVWVSAVFMANPSFLFFHALCFLLTFSNHQRWWRSWLWCGNCALNFQLHTPTCCLSFPFHADLGSFPPNIERVFPSLHFSVVQAMFRISAVFFAMPAIPHRYAPFRRTINRIASNHQYSLAARGRRRWRRWRRWLHSCPRRCTGNRQILGPPPRWPTIVMPICTNLVGLALLPEDFETVEENLLYVIEAKALISAELAANPSLLFLNAL